MFRSCESISKSVFVSTNAVWISFLISLLLGADKPRDFACSMIFFIAIKRGAYSKVSVRTLVFLLSLWFFFTKSHKLSVFVAAKALFILPSPAL